MTWMMIMTTLCLYGVDDYDNVEFDYDNVVFVWRG